jgi:hypothetical protein
MFGKTHSQETKDKIAASITRLLGEHKKNLSLAHPNSQKLEVLDLKTNQTTFYSSIREAAKALGCDHALIRHYLKSKNPLPFKGRYEL